MLDAQTVIHAKNLRKRYQHILAVDGVSFDVHAGEFFGLLGPNGAGKTTIMKMLYHFSRRNEGELKVLGLDADKEPSAIKYSLGIVSQENNLDPELNLWENLYVYCNYYNMDPAVRLDRIESLLDFFDLGSRKHSSIRTLSGGIKRRLVIARALLNNPKVLLLDEPTTGLDPATRHLIWDKLRELKKSGLTLVLTTHYMEEAAHLCDRLVIMDAGRILIEGTPHALVKHYFARFVLETEQDFSTSEEEGVRKENHGHRFFYYSDNEALLRVLLEKSTNNIQSVLRQPTLEDLFLKLTGRILHD
jgi:lipooligosaccharide transport system ATP-binding protein